jgi:hypothetical protein
MHRPAFAALLGAAAVAAVVPAASPARPTSSASTAKVTYMLLVVQPVGPTDGSYSELVRPGHWILGAEERVVGVLWRGWGTRTARAKVSVYGGGGAGGPATVMLSDRGWCEAAHFTAYRRQRFRFGGQTTTTSYRPTASAATGETSGRSSS